MFVGGSRLSVHLRGASPRSGHLVSQQAQFPCQDRHFRATRPRPTARVTASGESARLGVAGVLVMLVVAHRTAGQPRRQARRLTRQLGTDPIRRPLTGKRKP